MDELTVIFIILVTIILCLDIIVLVFIFSIKDKTSEMATYYKMLQEIKRLEDTINESKKDREGQ